MSSHKSLFGRAAQRGLSPVVGVVVLLAITLLLVGTTAAMTTGVLTETKGSAAYHGVATFEYDHLETNNDLLVVRPEATASTESTTYELHINDREVWEWDGTSRLDVTCLYPGDSLSIRSEKGDTAYRLEEHTMERSTRCERESAMDKKFEYAYIDGERRQILPDWKFSFEVDPDGPGVDSGGRPMFKRDNGPISTANEWHYMKRYTKPIEGFEPPVWVIVMTDNVHWKSGTNYDSYNWTDEPPGEPGIDSYTIDDGDVVPQPGGSEPTNDVYVVFKPGCDGSKLKIVDVSAGYHNQLLVDGKVAVPDTRPYNDDPSKLPKTLDAPAVSCPSN